ncbi:uncharacterized RNA pseudouridine synthase yhcT [Waddlia chondrophila 2032/99]|uniref:RNA pseudouridylate synthase family protein n=2 Tax=Waddlia chondrophila TaxID=71667 RepID=D6YVW8_WADCW|nr:RluA family pseudouridine synthase [Waddlia chondrophila]ADI38279.1 RNA pseudouridylate synthase family protein [Waddlia chondrophila WSU 86-1044]CCB91360.1 uncharacterized RNA pseudouridine synthase yhcT [Waddlia chondrophila 2032/99]
MISSTVLESGIKLVDFIHQKLQGKHSLRKIKRAIENNHVCVNGAVERFYSFQLSKGDLVEFDDSVLEKSESEKPVPERDAILFEDDHLLIYNKPSGMNSDEFGLGKFFPSFPLIHRLDKETTGCIMFAKYPKVKNRMIELFKGKKISKHYLAVVDGVPNKREGVEESFIGQISSNPGSIKWGNVSPKQGQHAKTQWMIEKRGKEAALLKMQPITGRTHQLRVHAAQMGHPILGDFRYCRHFKCSYQPSRTLLHAYTLHFPHPILDAYLKIKAPIPADMKQAIRQTCR